MTKRRTKNGKHSNKIHKYNKTTRQTSTRRISRHNKESRARGFILKTDLSSISNKNLIKNFTICEPNPWNLEFKCGPLKNELMKRLIKFKQDKILETKNDMTDEYIQKIQQSNKRKDVLYKNEDVQLKNEINKLNLQEDKTKIKQLIHDYKIQRTEDLQNDAKIADKNKEKYEKTLEDVEPDFTYYIEEQLDKLCKITSNPKKCNANVQKYIEMDKPLQSPIFDFKGSIGSDLNSASSSVFASPRLSPRSAATSPRSARLSNDLALSSTSNIVVSNTDIISVIILNANRIKCLLQLFKTKNYKKVTEQIYIVKLIFKEKVFYFILIEENIRFPTNISGILVNYLFIADTFDYAKTLQITSHFDISNVEIVILPCAHNIGKYDGNCDAAAGKSVSNYKSKCNNWTGTDIDKKKECNTIDIYSVDWSLYKTAYNKVRTTALLYKSKDVIKCRNTDLLTVALKYIVDSPEQIIGNLQNELVDDEDLVKMRQYHSTIFQFLESFNPDILYNAPRNSREELEEFKSIKLSPQAAVNEQSSIKPTYTAGIKANKNEFKHIILQIKSLNTQIERKKNEITSIENASILDNTLKYSEVIPYKQDLKILEDTKNELNAKLGNIKQMLNTFVDKSKQIKVGKSRKLKRY